MDNVREKEIVCTWASVWASQFDFSPFKMDVKQKHSLPLWSVSFNTRTIGLMSVPSVSVCWCLGEREGEGEKGRVNVCNH